MTDYLKKTFAVGSPGTKEYADRWERTFRGEKGAAATAPDCGACAHVAHEGRVCGAFDAAFDKVDQTWEPDPCKCLGEKLVEGGETEAGAADE